jgi:arylsulfatase A
LLKDLDDSKLRENTIIIFQSDHGHSVEERAHHGGGSAGHFRGAKFSLFEGGLRVPAIVSWPGTLPEGAMREQLAYGCDWLPTIAELCGAELVNRDIDGKSLAGVLKDENTLTSHSSLEWMTGDPRNPEWAVLKGDWKVLGNVRAVGVEKLSAQDKELFLVNLHEDPSETVNLRDSSADILKELLSVRSNELKALRP